MKCPICSERVKVTETTNDENDVTYRIKECVECGFKFVTKEEITCMALSLARRRWIGKTSDKRTCTNCNNFRICNTVTKKSAKYKSYPCWEEVIQKSLRPEKCCENCTFKDECEEDLKTTAEKEKYWCWSKAI